MYLIIGGNMVDGHTFWGPFNTFEDAEEWAISGQRWEWAIAEMQPPN